MADDPIVDELHRIRQELLEEHDGPEGYARHLQELEKELKGRIVRREPRPPAAPKRKTS